MNIQTPKHDKHESDVNMQFKITRKRNFNPLNTFPHFKRIASYVCMFLLSEKNPKSTKRGFRLKFRKRIKKRISGKSRKA